MFAEFFHLPFCSKRSSQLAQLCPPGQWQVYRLGNGQSASNRQQNQALPSLGLDIGPNVGGDAVWPLRRYSVAWLK